MHTFLAVLVSAVQMFYEAQVPTFGCNSIDAATRLQEVRSDEKAFQALLSEQLVQGECVLFAQGAVVEGSIEKSNSSMLHVQAQIDPPGYIAPIDDFKPKNGDGGK
jgi:hypothetical protein